MLEALLEVQPGPDLSLLLGHEGVDRGQVDQRLALLELLQVLLVEVSAVRLAAFFFPAHPLLLGVEQSSEDFLEVSLRFAAEGLEPAEQEREQLVELLHFFLLGLGERLEALAEDCELVFYVEEQKLQLDEHGLPEVGLVDLVVEQVDVFDVLREPPDDRLFFLDRVVLEVLQDRCEALEQAQDFLFVGARVARLFEVEERVGEEGKAAPEDLVELAKYHVALLGRGLVGARVFEVGVVDHGLLVQPGLVLQRVQRGEQDLHPGVIQWLLPAQLAERALREPLHHVVADLEDRVVVQVLLDRRHSDELGVEEAVELLQVVQAEAVVHVFEEGW